VAALDLRLSADEMREIEAPDAPHATAGFQ
jgi:hypothetical protein